MRHDPEPEAPALVRCRSCLGLRSLSHRNRDTAAHCLDCRRGEVVPRGVSNSVSPDLSYGARPGDEDDGGEVLPRGRSER